MGNKNDSGKLHSFIVFAPSRADPRAPIVFYIPGAGRMGSKQVLKPQNSPKPSWAVMFDEPGNYRVRMPAWLQTALERFRAMTRGENHSVLFGSSRGAAWAIDLVLADGGLVDAAVLVGGYPWTSASGLIRTRRRLSCRLPRRCF